LNFEPKFKTGDTVILTTDQDYLGKEKVPVNYAKLHIDLSVGDTVMADDGTLKFSVSKLVGQDIHMTAENDGQLKSLKGINVPFVKMNTLLVTEKDESMINFACENEIDFIGISFVESAKHLEEIRKLVGGRSLRIIAKIENQRGLENLEEIVLGADAIMIDRGDLSVETSLHDLAIKQKRIINEATKYGKPVIVATEMLHTMIENSYPTKAEVADISNAVLDGASATMLSGETAIGKFPVEAVITMRKIIEASEVSLFGPQDSDAPALSRSVSDAISSAIPLICRELPITKVVVITRSGYAANMISRASLSQPVIAVSDDYMASKSFNLIPGTKGVFSSIPFSKITSDHIFFILKKLYSDEILEAKDFVVVSGIIYPVKGSRMNTIQIFKIGELAKEFAW
jgi:pyruvate kinase